jgi:hypothetical protein
MKLIFSLLLLAVLGSPACAQKNVDPTVVLKSVPDLLQTTKKANFPKNGKAFCGPVAVSNSLVWLEGKTNRSHQIEVVKKLSGPNYMDTDDDIGTSCSGIIRGVHRYATEIWGSYYRLEYCGWRKVPNSKLVGKQPKLDWIIAGVHDKAAVWINVGWYKYSQNDSIFLRTGGHWVTVTGYKNGKLLLHDPAPRAGKSKRLEVVEIQTLKNGQLTGNKKGLPLDATGYLELGKGMHISSKADRAIIDGVVILELSPPEPTRTWTSRDGKFEIQAKYVSRSNEQVELLKIKDSKKIKVTIAELSEEDKQYLTTKETPPAPTVSK